MLTDHVGSKNGVRKPARDKHIRKVHKMKEDRLCWRRLEIALTLRPSLVILLPILNSLSYSPQIFHDPFAQPNKQQLLRIHRQPQIRRRLSLR